MNVNKHIGDEDIIHKSIYSSIGPYHNWTDTSSEYGGVYNLEFSPDGSLLVAACEKKSVILFDPITNRKTNSIKNAHSDCVNCVKFIDGRLFATCSDDSTVALWDIRNLKTKVRSLHGHLNWVKNIEYSRKDNLLVTSGFDGSIFTWDINSSTEQGYTYQKVFHTAGLMRCRISPDASKLVICTTGGYLIIVHNLDLQMLARDLHGFRPNIHRLMQLGRQLIPYAASFKHLFSKSVQRNRVELISDFPCDNDAEIHPQGWCALSRNISYDESSEYTCVHDIQEWTNVDDEDTNLVNNASNTNFVGENSSTSSDEDGPRVEQPTRNATIDVEPLHHPDIWAAEMTFRERSLGLRRRNTSGVGTTNVYGIYGIRSGVLPVRLLDHNETTSDESSVDSRKPFHEMMIMSQNEKRMLYYIEEPNRAKGFIKELCFSSDGRIICSPHGMGCRLLAFSDTCAEIPNALSANHKAQRLKEIKCITCHSDVVVSTKFSPRHSLVVTGCLGGKIVWHQPTKMASISDGDDEIMQEETGTRKTRSGRKVSKPPATSRTTRRSTRKKSEPDLNDQEQQPTQLTDDHNQQYITAEETINVIADEPKIDQLLSSIDEKPEIQNDNSLSFPFGNHGTSDLTALYDQSSIGANNDSAPPTDSIDNLLANLAEDNANSLPSGDDESRFASAEINHSGDGLKSEDVDALVSELVHSAEVDQNDTVSDPAAVAEELPNGDNSQDTKLDIDAEMVSEDELPAPSQEKVDDAEEVSDDELPGPKLAELPEDTEVVSEDELPSSNKNKRKADVGYDPCSPTESLEVPEKKTKIDEPQDVEEKKEEKPADTVEEKKVLPELEKYWKAVNDDPTNFTGWTYLLQYVDMEVFERGLKSIPLSVDLWIHYLTHVKQKNPDDEEYIRVQFDRALVSCGLEFRSDKLWEAYIKWETDGKRFTNVINIYDRLLATPTQGYNGHFDSFQEVVNNNPILSLINIDEFKKFRADVRESGDKDALKSETEDLAPGEDEPDDHVRDEEETAAIKDKILSSRRKIHKQNVAAVTARWTFEEGIKRPYFHVKPLERCQLKNWKEYLDFEIEQGDRNRILVLFERCLIACALYDEFWLKLIRYLESQNDESLIEKTRDVYFRACTVHHTDKPALHMLWASFEECQNDLTKAQEILTNLDTVCPNLLQVAYKRINIERRKGDYNKCTELYEHYINTAKNKNIVGTLTIKYARFCNKIKGDLNGGITILKAALDKDPANTRLALQMIDLLLQRPVVDETEVVSIMNTFMEREGIEPDQKLLFAQRKVDDAAIAKKSTKETTTQPASSSSSAYYGNYGSGNNSSYYNASQYGTQPYSDSYGYNQWQQYGSGYGNAYSNAWSGYSSSGYY
ncbi:Pre-mRNA-processing factor 39 [Pseudolycoriella hygida]|uniref:Pre-mRNA-processing factor 39 n=1 Tax=Pseudolycoriella hygida TaxID=35572 RepID=A0A9Q0MSA8_9DIPT|nr:Pre-mRNA-processing factor 39 [Pseudolycoriella hygida]